MPSSRNLTAAPVAALRRCPRFLALTLMTAAVTRSLVIIISYLGTSPRKFEKPTRNPCVFRSARSPVGLFWTAVILDLVSDEQRDGAERRVQSKPLTALGGLNGRNRSDLGVGQDRAR